jgi:hypothetical protein
MKLRKTTTTLAKVELHARFTRIPLNNLQTTILIYDDEILCVLLSSINMS